MRVRQLELKGRNTGLLEERKICNDQTKDCGYVKIISGRFTRCGTSSPLIGAETLYYHRNRSLRFKNKIIYSFHEFGVKKDGTIIFVGFNRRQHFRFLWMQHAHWLQQDQNIKYIIGVVITIASFIGYKIWKG